MRKIGRYELESELGRGNMGVVYLANDHRLRRKVAVKTFTIPDGMSEEQATEYRERFLREAWAAGSLSHPLIVTIYDAGEDPSDGSPYIAMEYVHGHSLDQVLKETGSLESYEVLELGSGLAEALAVAHSSGIVHRDIKPANILVDEAGGKGKIADFGVARAASSKLTRTGRMLGSPAYMSPEQVRGRDVDSRSDLFSLAVILYQALTGKRPFAGDDLPALAYSICHENHIPPSRLRTDLSPAVDRFFDRALAKEPGDRFPDGEAFRSAMVKAWRSKPPFDPEATAVEQAPPTREREASGRRAKPLRAGVAVIGLLAVIWLWQLIFNNDATLCVDVRNSVESGELTLQLDGDEIYSRELHAEGAKLKRAMQRLVRGGQETFTTEFDIEPGTHEITAEVNIESGDTSHRKTITLELEPDEERRLKLVLDGTFGKPISMKID